MPAGESITKLMHENHPALFLLKLDLKLVIVPECYNILAARNSSIFEKADFLVTALR